jgi:cytochrome P450
MFSKGLCTPTHNLRLFNGIRSRLSCPQPGATRIVAAQSATIKDGSQSISLKEGDLVFVDFATASLDASKFPDPKTFKLDRPEASYINFGVGPHSCLGQPISVLAAATMLKSIGKVKNLKRVPGKAGEIRSKVVGGTRLYLTTDASAWVGMPQS